MSRPSLFTADKIKDIAINAAELGHTDTEIATIVGISQRTLERWKLLDKKFCQSLKEAKVKSDLEVEASLRMRAIGFERTINKQMVTKEGVVIDYTDTVYFPPDTMACNSWLNNRNPERWRDRREVRANINHTINWLDFITKCEEEGNGTGENRIAGLVTETDRISTRPN